MLGDLDFKSRGWGNVSVENNHIDVYIFEFAEIMKWLSAETDEPRFAKMADVIKSSMLQLMPVKDNLCGMGKVGYSFQSKSFGGFGCVNSFASFSN